MRAIEKELQSSLQTFGVRPMAERDLFQLAEIERDTFPTLFPPPPSGGRCATAWQTTSLRGGETTRCGAIRPSRAAPKGPLGRRLLKHESGRRLQPAGSHRFLFSHLPLWTQGIAYSTTPVPGWHIFQPMSAAFIFVDQPGRWRVINPPDRDGARRRQHRNAQ